MSLLVRPRVKMFTLISLLNLPCFVSIARYLGKLNAVVPFKALHV